MEVYKTKVKNIIFNFFLLSQSIKIELIQILIVPKVHKGAVGIGDGNMGIFNAIEQSKFN